MPGATFRSLSELIKKIDLIEPRLIMYAAKPWSAQSPIWAAPFDGADDRPDGYEYMLEVFLAQEAIEAWSVARGHRVPNNGEACEAVLFYAEHDAYLPTGENQD
jgi:hypothetical protein